MVSAMRFDPAKYGEAVEAILALDGSGQRLMPLVCGACSSGQARTRLLAAGTEALFPRARAAGAAMAGLWLYFSCFEESHRLSQEIGTPEGSFWHGILHRREPDPGNAAYWFRRVGRHPVFGPLGEEAAKLAARNQAAGFAPGSRWDPFAFIDFCEAARSQPGSPAERLALQVQLVEWQLLFDYCARP